MRNKWTSFKSLASLGLGASLGLVVMGVGSCGDKTPIEEMPPIIEETPPTVVPMNPEMAFDHDGVLSPVGDVFADGQQVPVEKSQRMHACGKLTYPTLSRILSRRGVTVTAGAQCTDANGSFDCTAGSLYVSGNLVLGTANYPARVSESDRNSTGGIVRMQDILIAASEMLVTSTNQTGTFAATGNDCAGASLFNAGTPATCNADGFACYVGVPLTQGQLTLCNQMLADRDINDPLIAKRLTLSALASSIFLCD